jgi:methylmalonyl-CoA/ethylmalonyl-CoA epimerase
MIEKIDHIGVAVQSIDKALGLFRDVLELELGGTEEVATQKVQVAFLKVGETRLELLEPTQEDSNVGKYLASKGEGIHHVALKVDNIEAALAQLKAQGVRLINEQPVPGAHGARVAFLHPKGTYGMLLELVEKK